VGFGGLATGIAGLNPAQDMGVCRRLSVLCCPVEVETLYRADPLSREFYQMPN
jgi:hypothetical protein